MLRSIFSVADDPEGSCSLLPNKGHHALNIKMWSDPSCFYFESLQYSYRVSIAFNKSPFGPIQFGKTYFVWPQPSDTYALSWENRSWRPVVNGFILDGR